MAGAPVSTMSSSRVPFGISGCSDATVSATPSSPVAQGTSVVLVGAATCEGLPEFRFWTSRGGTKTVVADWLGASQLTLNTSGLTTGGYQVGVDVRNIGSIAAAGETTAARQLVVEAPSCPSLPVTAPGCPQPADRLSS